MSDESLDFSEFLPDPEPAPAAVVARDTRSEAQKLRHTKYAHTYLALGSHAATCRKLGYPYERQPDSAYLRAEIKALQEAAAAKYAITPQNVLKEYARMAYFDLKSVVDEDGNPIAIQDLPSDVSAALAGMDVMKLGKDDNFAEVLKYKAPNKQQALDSLSKNLGLFEKDNAQSKPEAGAIDAYTQNEVARRVAFYLQETMRKQGEDGANKEA